MKHRKSKAGHKKRVRPPLAHHVGPTYQDKNGHIKRYPMARPAIKAAQSVQGTRDWIAQIYDSKNSR